MNTALREDVEKLTADWTRAQNELELKGSEWRTEREVGLWWGAVNKMQDRGVINNEILSLSSIQTICGSYCRFGYGLMLSSRVEGIGLYWWKMLMRQGCAAGWGQMLVSALCMLGLGGH